MSWPKAKRLWKDQKHLNYLCDLKKSCNFAKELNRGDKFNPINHTFALVLVIQL